MEHCSIFLFLRFEDQKSKNIKVGEINNIHDKTFKEFFSHPEEAKDFVHSTFPKELLEKLDLSTFEPEPSFYIDESLSEYFSDIVYNCLYFGKIKIKICLLFEHKSRPEEYPHLQLLQYLLGIWNRNLKERKKLEIAIPIVFYHGIQNWNYRTLDNYFEGIDDFLRKFLPMFDYILIDTVDISYDKIKRDFRQKLMKFYLYIVKFMYDPIMFEENLTDFFEDVDYETLSDRETKLIEAAFIYIYNTINIEPMKIAEIIMESSEKVGEAAMTGAEMLLKRGMEKGMEKGEYLKAIETIIKGSKKGVSMELLAELTGLKKHAIKKIIKLAESHPKITRYDIYDLLTSKE